MISLSAFRVTVQIWTLDFIILALPIQVSLFIVDTPVIPKAMEVENSCS